MQSMQSYLILTISFKGLSYNLCYYTVIDKLLPETRMLSSNLCIFIYLCMCLQKVGPNSSHWCFQEISNSLNNGTQGYNCKNKMLQLQLSTDPR